MFLNVCLVVCKMLFKTEVGSNGSSCLVMRSAPFDTEKLAPEAGKLHIFLGSSFMAGFL